MADVKGTVDKGLSYFKPPSLNCAQSVVLAMIKDVYGITDPLQLAYITKMTTPFGGGNSNQGRDCGAVSGGEMAIGFKYGTSTPKESRSRIYSLVKEFNKRFERKFGSIYCTDLCECDLSTTEGLEKFGNEKVHENVCHKYVAGAIEILMEMLKEIDTGTL